MKPQNYYYEYQKWSLFWGLFLDQNKEIQNVLNKYNSEGWIVRDFEWGSIPKIPFFQILMIVLITIISFGFFSFWVGFSIVFEKIEAGKSSNSPNLKESNIFRSDIELLDELLRIGVISENEYSAKKNKISIDKKISEKYINEIVSSSNKCNFIK